MGSKPANQETLEGWMDENTPGWRNKQSWELECANLKDLDERGLLLPATSDLTLGQAFAYHGVGCHMPVSGDTKRVVDE